MLRTKSKGSVRLRSKDPYAAPIITTNYLTHPDDVKVVILLRYNLILKLAIGFKYHLYRPYP